MVSGQTPIVLKDKMHDWLAHSVSRIVAGFVIWRQMEAFPVIEFHEKLIQFSPKKPQILQTYSIRVQSLLSLFADRCCLLTNPCESDSWADPAVR